MPPSTGMLKYYDLFAYEDGFILLLPSHEAPTVVAPFEEKMKNITSELSKQFEESHKLEEEIKKDLKAIGYEI